MRYDSGLPSEPLRERMTTCLTCTTGHIGSFAVSPGEQETALRRLVESANALEELREKLKPHQVIATVLAADETVCLYCRGTGRDVDGDSCGECWKTPGKVKAS